MGWWAWLTGSKQADKAMDIATKATDGLIAGLDAVWFTDEEKSMAALEITRAAIRMVETTQGESTTRSITRRVLAWAIMGAFLFLLVGGALIYKFDAAWAGQFLLAAKSLTFLATPVGVFYFGYYGVKSVKG